jgi:hypothetical protein
MLRTIRTMAPAAMASTLLLVGCSTPQLPNSQTASEQFSRLGPAEKRVASTFYDLGQGDAVKRLYWAQRRAQESGGTVDAQPTISLQRKYVVLPVPEHVEPDGTVKEANNQVVEVVQFWAVTQSHGRRLFLVQ